MIMITTKIDDNGLRVVIRCRKSKEEDSKKKHIGNKRRLLKKILKN